jgi:hypothetical protein
MFNRATITIVPTGQTKIATSEFYNLGVMKMETDGVALSTPSTPGIYWVNNDGLLLKDGGIGTNFIQNLQWWDVGGTNEVDTGTIEFDGPANPGAAIEFYKSIFKGAGTVVFNNNPVFESTKFSGPGQVIFNNGAFFYDIDPGSSNLVLVGGTFGGRGVYAYGNDAGDLFGHALWLGGQFSQIDNMATVTIVPSTNTGIGNGGFNNYGTLQGIGTIYASNAFFYNYGNIQPGSPFGPLQMNGDLTLQTNGSVNINIGGAGTNQFASLNLSGTLFAAGTLVVSNQPGFVPVGGTQWPIITYSNRVGTFDALNLPSGMAVVYTDSGVTLFVTNAPAVQIESPQQVGSGLGLQFGTVSNQSYTLQRSPDLSPEDWVSFSNFVGDGTPIQISISTSNSAQEFFRVREP